MNIFITGGTGFIGRALVQRWLAQGHSITLLSRFPERVQKLFRQPITAVNSLENFCHFNDFDCIVNLAGEPIFARRWTATQKQILWQSRVNLTEKLTALINQSQTPPSCFISASATGFYGDGGENEIDEFSASGNGFTAQLCQAWEQAARYAKTRVCVLRIGMPFSQQGGALAKILPLYRYGLGGKLGSGAQFMPWIALEDMLNAIDFLIQQAHCQGAFNLCTPQAIRNREFNRLLGSKLKRPHFVSAPAWLLKLMLGERACLVLDSQKIKPTRLSQAGFTFQFPDFSYWLKKQDF